MHPCRGQYLKQWPSSPHLSSRKLSSPWSLLHINQVVPCKPSVTQNKLPLLWMGQNNTEMSLFHCNWSCLWKHKSIVSIIAVSPAPQRFLHEDSFASFHLSTDYYFHVSYFCNLWGCTLRTYIIFNAFHWVFVAWHLTKYLTLVQYIHFALQLAKCSVFDILNSPRFCSENCLNEILLSEFIWPWVPFYHYFQSQNVIF